MSKVKNSTTSERCESRGTWDLNLGRNRILGKRKLVDLNRELQGIIDQMPVFMPDVKADVILLCYQAEIGRQYLRSHRDEKKN